MCYQKATEAAKVAFHITTTAVDLIDLVILQRKMIFRGPATSEAF